MAGDGWALRSLQPKPFYDSLLCFSVNLKFNFLVFSETCYCKEDLEMFTTRNICVLTTYVDPQTDARLVNTQCWRSILHHDTVKMGLVEQELSSVRLL